MGTSHKIEGILFLRLVFGAIGIQNIIRNANCTLFYLRCKETVIFVQSCVSYILSYNVQHYLIRKQDIAIKF